MEETWVGSLGWEDPLKKEVATHYSTLAWKIPQTGEHGRLKSMGSQRVRHDWATSLSLSFIPQFGLLYQVISHRLSSGHWGLVLTLNMQPVPPCPASACWWQIRVSGLLLHWELRLGMFSVFLFFFFSSWLCCLLRFQNSPQTCLWEGFLLYYSWVRVSSDLLDSKVSSVYNGLPMMAPKITGNLGWGRERIP